MSIRRRLERLEGSSVANRVPNVIEIDTLANETLEQACERFRRKWGSLPHRGLVVPAKPKTPEERAEFRRQFREQQLRIIAEAESSRPKKEVANEHVSSHFFKRS